MGRPLFPGTAATRGGLVTDGSLGDVDAIHKRIVSHRVSGVGGFVERDRDAAGFRVAMIAWLAVSERKRGAPHLRTSYQRQMYPVDLIDLRLIGPLSSTMNGLPVSMNRAAYQEASMGLWTVLFVILLVAWITGFGIFHVAGALIHLLLIFAVISLILHFVMGRRVA